MWSPIKIDQQTHKYFLRRVLSLSAIYSDSHALWHDYICFLRINEHNWGMSQQRAGPALLDKDVLRPPQVICFKRRAGVVFCYTQKLIWRQTDYSITIMGSRHLGEKKTFAGPCQCGELCKSRYTNCELCSKPPPQIITALCEAVRLIIPFTSAKS